MPRMPPSITFAHRARPPRPRSRSSRAARPRRASPDIPGTAHSGASSRGFRVEEDGGGCVMGIVWIGVEKSPPAPLYERGGAAPVRLSVSPFAKRGSAAPVRLSVPPFAKRGGAAPVRLSVPPFAKRGDRGDSLRPAVRMGDRGDSFRPAARIPCLPRLRVGHETMSLETSIDRLNCLVRLCECRACRLR